MKINLTTKQIRAWFECRRRLEKVKEIGGDLSAVCKGVDADLEASFDLNGNGTSLKRQNYPDAILQQLEKAFIRNKYISGSDKKLLAERLQLTPIQIERWFYYRRRKSGYTHKY